MKIFCSVSLLLLMLSGCSAGYHQKGLLSSSGYSETRLGENVFQINFEGKSRHNSEQVTDLNLLRAAEVTLKHGYSYFVLLQTSDSPDSHIFDEEPDVSVSTDQDNPLHTATTIILCSNIKPDISHGKVYKAEVVAAAIRKKYNM